MGVRIRSVLVALGAMVISAGAMVALADYTATQGTGTTFASLIRSGAHYMAYVLCDATAGETQCAAVNSSGQLAVAPAFADPCSSASAKTNVPISTSSGTTALVTGVAAKRIYVCSFVLITQTVVSVSLSEGSSNTCGTSAQAAVIGVATNGTAANGMSLSSNGGVAIGAGNGTVAATATDANYLCLFQSGTAQIAGNLTYVQQ